MSMIPVLRRRAQEAPHLCARCGAPRTIILFLHVMPNEAEATLQNVIDTLRLPVCNTCVAELLFMPSAELLHASEPRDHDDDDTA